MSKKLIPALRDAGYVETAPACGDCFWATDEAQGTYCSHARCLVSEHARCQKWEPAAHWLKANPHVSASYAGLHAHDALSPAELAYAHKDHALSAPAKLPKWPFPNAQCSKNIF